MNIYEYNGHDPKLYGKVFRRLRRGEIIATGDYFCDRAMPGKVNSDSFKQTIRARATVTGEYGLHYWREVDPLIAAMLKAKGKTYG